MKKLFMDMDMDTDTIQLFMRAIIVHMVHHSIQITEAVITIAIMDMEVIIIDNEELICI